MRYKTFRNAEELLHYLRPKSYSSEGDNLFSKGYRTTEFWVTLFAVAGVFLAGLTDAIPAQYSVYLTTAIAVAYAASRGIQKYGNDLNKGYKTTEFFIAVGTVGLTVLQTVQSNVPDKTVALSITILTAAFAAIRAFSKPNPIADQFHPALTGNGYAGVKDDNPNWQLDEGDAKSAVVDDKTAVPFDQEATEVKPSA